MIKNFKIRCSAIGRIMSGRIGPPEGDLNFIKEMDAREKPMTDKMKERYNSIKNMKPELPAGAKSYCEEWLKEQLYGMRSEVNSKYLTKGIECEDESISFLNRTYGIELKKNICSFEDEHITGTPDLILENLVWDVKTSWDFQTFPLFEKVLSRDYYWQLQGYMKLVNAGQAAIKYVLINTPEELDPRLLNYSKLGPSLRIKSFDVERNEDDINAIAERVNLCRDYIHEILKPELMLSMEENLAY